MNRVSSSAVCLVIVALLGGCTRTQSHELQLALPPSAPYHTATLRGRVETSRIPALPGPEHVPDSEVWLSLEVDGVALVSEHDDSDAIVARTCQIAAGNWRLSAARDGHALAYSIDGGLTWHAAFLDVAWNGSRYPFTCSHRTFTAPPGVEAGDAAPATRLIAIDVLHGQGRDPKTGERDATHGYTDDDELRGAILFALQHPDDEELAQTLAQFIPPTLSESIWKEPTLGWVREPLLMGLGSSATRFPSVRSVLDEGGYVQVAELIRIAANAQTTLRSMVGPDGGPASP